VLTYGKRGTRWFPSNSKWVGRGMSGPWARWGQFLGQDMVNLKCSIKPYIFYESWTFPISSLPHFLSERQDPLKDLFEVDEWECSFSFESPLGWQGAADPNNKGKCSLLLLSLGTHLDTNLLLSLGTHLDTRCLNYCPALSRFLMESWVAHGDLICP
jgi:hypothetical protein